MPAASPQGAVVTVHEVYRRKLVLDGCHTRSDRFAEVWCDFDYLDAWAEPPSATVEGDARDSIEVREQV